MRQGSSNPAGLRVARRGQEKLSSAKRKEIAKKAAKARWR